jgi:hypothetical protein
MLIELVLSLSSLAASGQHYMDNLPDFSRAGYRRGSPPPTLPATIDPRDFGARPGDGKDDGPALQAALDAAAEAGGGVVRLSEGDWTLASRVSIHANHVVLQGVGSGETLITCPKSLTDIEGENRNWSWSGGLVTLAPRGPTVRVGTCPERVAAGSVVLPIKVADGRSPPCPGEWLQLAWYNDTGADTLIDHLHGSISYPEAMTRELRERTDARVTEWVHVESFADGQMRVSTPLGLELRPEWAPMLTRLPHVRESGIEGLAFLFPKTKRQPHLKEKGYNAITLSRAIDCWVRDVVVDNGDSGIIIENSRQVTVDGAVLSGKGMHHPLLLSRSTDCLVTNWRIDAPHRHGTTLTWGAHRNVYSHGWGRDLAMDCHRANSFENLHTQIEIEVTGDLRQPLHSGGSYGRGPHSGRRNIYWNIAFQFLDPEDPIEITGLAEWPRGVFVGWHGNHAIRLRSEDRYAQTIADRNKRPAIVNLHEHQVQRALTK